MDTSITPTLEKIDDFNAEPAAADLPPADADEATKAGLDLLDANEAICEGGPTRTEVEAIKTKLPPGTCLLFTPLVDNRGILWRTLNRGEWRKLRETLAGVDDDSKREDAIFTRICLFPEVRVAGAIDALPAGAVPMVMNEFYLNCGFTPLMESIRL